MPQNLCACLRARLRHGTPACGVFGRPFEIRWFVSVTSASSAVNRDWESSSVNSVISVLKICSIPDLNTEDTENAEAEDGNLKPEVLRAAKPMAATPQGKG